MLKHLLQRIRTVFLAGLLVTLPLAVTVWVLITLVAFVDSVIAWVPVLVPAGWIAAVMAFYPSFLPVGEHGLPQGLGVLVAVLTLFIVGVLARSYLGGRLIALYEWLLLRVPVASSIYQAVKELLELVLARDGNAFERVVLVEWPRPGLYSVGFLNGEAWVSVEGRGRMVNVFLPTTPNPTTGFFAMLPEDQVILTDMTVEQGFKILMSAGLVSPPGRLQLPRRALGGVEAVEPALGTAGATVVPGGVAAAGASPASVDQVPEPPDGARIPGP
jgi:uncharacterized membrane protein